MRSAREIRYSVALDATTDALMKSAYRKGWRNAIAASGDAVRNHPGNGKRAALLTRIASLQPDAKQLPECK